MIDKRPEEKSKRDVIAFVIGDSSTRYFLTLSTVRLGRTFLLALDHIFIAIEFAEPHLKWNCLCGALAQAKALLS